MLRLSTLLFLFGSVAPLSGQLNLQPPTGPGSSERYVLEEVEMINEAGAAGGFWLFLPEGELQKPAPVVVFLHGYGVFNPMVYGEWIRHLVRQGQVVLFPRYQNNRVWPRPGRFAELAARGIRDGLGWLETNWSQPVADTPLVLVGHSYGGTTAADLASRTDYHGLPPIAGVMMVTPGTSVFRGGILPDYHDLKPELDLLVVVNEKDDVVGEVLARKVYREADQVNRKGYYTLLSEPEAPLFLKSHHREPYSVYPPFDEGPSNGSTERALEWTELDAADYWVYWRMFDALCDCARSDRHCEVAFPTDNVLREWVDTLGVPGVQLLRVDDRKHPDSASPYPPAVATPATEVDPGK